MFDLRGKMLTIGGSHLQIPAWAMVYTSSYTLINLLKVTVAILPSSCSLRTKNFLFKKQNLPVSLVQGTNGKASPHRCSQVHIQCDQHDMKEGK